jgi:alpha-D-ribose 1-methylphosphonate 5-triphosphate synthase subunit PhnL
MAMTDEMIRVRGLCKTFVLHTQGGTVLPVFQGVEFSVGRGETVVLSGPSGTGKSTFMRLLLGNYKATEGSIELRHDGRMVDIVSEAPRIVLDVRRRSLGYVSQFLCVIPRVTTLDLVKDTLIGRGVDEASADRRAKAILERLNLPEALWRLAPATFSGGEQQRVNIARSFVDPAPIMLLDEPTASLDAANRAVVIDLVNEARQKGVAIVGIFHDESTRAALATRVFDLAPYKQAA